jgi:hypothetical protein
VRRRNPGSRSSPKALGKPTASAQSITSPPGRPDERCRECGGLMRIRPAGISKRTGKPYPEFACCERYPDCEGALRLPKPPPTT